MDGVPVDLIVRAYAVYVVPGDLGLLDAAARPLAPARVRRVDGVPVDLIVRGSAAKDTRPLPMPPAARRVPGSWRSRNGKYP